MQTVGVRDLKARLSEHLRNVRDGGAIVITSRGRPVARLVPAGPPGPGGPPPELEQRVWELAAGGFLSWSGQPFQAPAPVASDTAQGTLSDLVVEDRG